jgi:hypothetical protein
LLLIDILLHFLLGLLIESLDLVHLFRVKDVFVADLLEELEQERSLRLGSSLRDLLIEVRIQTGLLEDVPDDVCLEARLPLRDLCILEPLLPQRELEHLDPLDHVLVNVLLSAQLGLQLVDALLHLRLFEKPLGLSPVHLPLVLLQEVHDVPEADGGWVILRILPSIAWVVQVVAASSGLCL